MTVIFKSSQAVSFWINFAWSARTWGSCSRQSELSFSLSCAVFCPTWLWLRRRSFASYQPTVERLTIRWAFQAIKLIRTAPCFWVLLHHYFIVWFFTQPPEQLLVSFLNVNLLAGPCYMGHVNGANIPHRTHYHSIRAADWQYKHQSLRQVSDWQENVIFHRRISYSIPKCRSTHRQT